MCGPSSALKAINSNITNFANTMQSEAKTVFGNADAAVNKIMGSVGKIVDAGASQMGFNQAELNARRAQATQAGATMARNLKGAAGSAAAAVGGGNAVLPSGGQQSVVLDAMQKAAAATADAQNQITSEGYDRGNENYWKAISAEGNAPGIYKTASDFNESTMEANARAQKSQQEMDTASNWWKPLIEKGISAVAGVATGGLSNIAQSAAGSLFGGTKSTGPALTNITGNISPPVSPTGLPGSAFGAFPLF